MKFMGGPITEDNMGLILDRLYSRIPKHYQGDICDIFTHDKLLPEHHCAMVNYGWVSEFEDKMRKLDLSDPIEAMEQRKKR